ncbi:WavE lipopolysaccharide synthesis family protein [Desertivirga xinjiangensis]|uniref:WavE lipopolysaccharide synthesis family protein n=1 Tax=Desertivirga xinjiangensis TaxID=539206 RepID=UPI00210CB65E|nr:WavE lipopolysaccharide synthesis family protein [Pedobacter xinjiangensis]
MKDVMKKWPFYRKAIKLIIVLLERFGPYYLSVNTRIKVFNSDALDKYMCYSEILDDFSILVQGPIVVKDNFTLETLKLYKYIYPQINIVLSTWREQPSEVVEQIKKLGVIVIENEKPEFPGLSNVNFQLTSTSNGIDYLVKNTNTKYLLKTRTDQRCNKSIDFLSYMRFLQQRFPVNSNLNERLIICSVNSFKRRLYGVTDMFMFGHIQDMKNYWCIPLDEKRKVEGVLPSELYMKSEVAEGYLINRFFDYLNYRPLWTEEDSNQFLSSYFNIIDKEQIDLYWFKYDRYFESIMDFDLKRYRDWERMEFSNLHLINKEYNNN